MDIVELLKQGLLAEDAQPKQYALEQVLLAIVGPKEYYRLKDSLGWKASKYPKVEGNCR